MHVLTFAQGFLTRATHDPMKENISTISICAEQEPLRVSELSPGHKKMINQLTANIQLQPSASESDRLECQS